MPSRRISPWSITSSWFTERNSVLLPEHMTMLIVTHEMGFARDVSDWAMFMDGGVVVEEGTPDKLFSDPDQERTRNFLSKHLGDHH